MSSHKKHTSVKSRGYKSKKGDKTLKKLLPKRFFLILTILALAIIGLIIYEQLFMKSSGNIVTIRKQMLVRRSADLGFISRGLTGKAIDVNTGKIVVAARVFSLSDSNVYLELDLQHPPAGTLVDYIRYKTGRYVDNGEITIANTDTKNLLFRWQINKSFANLSNGSWKVATYTNGILAKRVLYTVENNRVSYVNSSEKISPTDSDYKLTDSLKKIAQR